MSELPSLRIHPPVWRTPVVNWRLSAELARVIEAEEDRCWTNALLAASLATERLGEPVHWVEGLAIARTGALALLHGWLEADRMVLDPTPAWSTQSGSGRGRRYMRIATVEAAELQRAHEVAQQQGGALRLPLWFNGQQFAEVAAREQAALAATTGTRSLADALRAVRKPLTGAGAGGDPYGLGWR